MEKTVKRLLRQFGTEILLLRGQTQTKVNALLQPRRVNGTERAQRRVTPLGDGNAGTFLYLGPGDAAVQAGDVLTLDGARYQIRQSSAVRLGSRTVYYRALCVELGGADRWGR